MTTSAPTTFGDFLRFLRKRAGLTQSDLGAAAGYSVSFISTLESGKRRPDPAAVSQRFVAALRLENEPNLAARLLELAGGPAVLDVSSAAPAHAAGSTLPQLPVELIGRRDDVDWICRRLMVHPGRLMTLTGPPGIGKTSLALAAAHALQSLHRDGARFVALETVEQPELVAATIAAALGIPETPLAADQRLAAFLRDKEVLLALDNFEQVTAAATLVAELLAGCPLVRVLVTSRERLRLRAEQVYPVPPLGLAPACALFVERSRAADPTLAFAGDDLDTIEAICRKLDGLPLAIELIAAQSELLSPAALLARLNDRRLDMLQGGAPDLPPEQRTLTNAIHRSYSLLPPAEQGLFRALGGFAGGCDLAAVDMLGFDLGTVQALVHKSLIRMEPAGGERRIVQLETLRDYARRQLAAAGETEGVEEQRLAYLVALAERAEPQLHSAAQLDWLHRLEANLPNLFGALDFALAAHRPVAAVRLAAALSHFWVTRNHLAETMRRLTLLRAALAAQDLDDHLWARLLNCQATLAFYLGDFDQARGCYTAALEHAERAGNRADLAYALDGLGADAANRDDLAAARAFSEQSLAHALAIDDRWLAGLTLMNLGEIARTENDYVTAGRRYAESLAHLEIAGDPFFVAVAQINQAQVCLHEGNLAAAERYLRRSLDAGLRAESAQVVAPALEKLADVFARRDSTRAVRLFGCAEGLRHASGFAIQPVDQADHDKLHQELLGMLGTPDYHAAFTAGARQEWETIRALVEP